MNVRTVLTFVSAHTFCASRKQLFATRALGPRRVDIDAIKFSYYDQNKFNEPVLKPGTPEKQHIAAVNCLRLPLWFP